MPVESPQILATLPHVIGAHGALVWNINVLKAQAFSSLPCTGAVCKGETLAQHRSTADCQLLQACSVCREPIEGIPPLDKGWGVPWGKRVLNLKPKRWEVLQEMLEKWVGKEEVKLFLNWRMILGTNLQVRERKSCEKNLKCQMFSKWIVSWKWSSLI